MIVAGVAVWAAFRYRAARRNQLVQSADSNFTPNTTADWDLAVEKVKAERDASLGGALEIPPELKHYEERYWFLATQVAEIEKYRVHLCQDYLDLAGMIERHELVPVPAVTDSYILFGIGQRANEEPFEPFEEEDNQNANVEPKVIPPEAFQSLRKLAQNFNGRSYDLNNPSDRYALKVNMLSAIRPEALKIMEQVASAYHRQFDRPLPVSSLVRPEQYQHALRRVNRNAVTIDAPPHSTGLAFDIDYRYMSVAEQNFVMRELARIKAEGRIEVIRERSANYHVFAFVNGARPNDDLITASLEKAGMPPKEEEAHHTEAKPVKKTERRSARAGKKTRSKAPVRRASRKRRR
jgi:D-alanyl-D-alanine dipeptidase